jgi:hypothetical protein
MGHTYTLDSIHELDQQGRDLTFDSVEKLEQKLLQDSDNLQVRIQLLGFYYKYYARPESYGPFVRHLLWVIENFPDHPEMHVTMIAGSRLKPKDFACCRNLWIIQTEKNPNNGLIHGNAGEFLHWADFESSECFLEKAKILEPHNARWPFALGHYASFQFGASLNLYKREYAQIAVTNGMLYLRQSGNDSVRFLAAMYVAQCATYLGDLETMFFCRQELLTEDSAPFERVAHELGGIIALSLGKIDAAEDALLTVKTGSKWTQSSRLLMEGLLKAGRREAVVSYIQRCIKVRAIKKKEGNEWIEQIESRRKLLIPRELDSWLI